MSLKSLPSTACKVKMGRYEAMMMPRAKKTGRCTSCAASRTFCIGLRLSFSREVADNIFDHHYRAVDNHSEIEGAQ